MCILSRNAHSTLKMVNNLLYGNTKKQFTFFGAIYYTKTIQRKRAIVFNVKTFKTWFFTLDQ